MKPASQVASGFDAAAEEHLLHPVDAHARAQAPDEEVEQGEHGDQHRHAPDRVQGQAPQGLARVRPPGLGMPDDRGDQFVHGVQPLLGEHEVERPGIARRRPGDERLDLRAVRGAVARGQLRVAGQDHQRDGPLVPVTPFEQGLQPADRVLDGGVVAHPVSRGARGLEARAERLDALARHGHGGHHLGAQQLLEARGVHLDAALAGLVHHVDVEQQGPVQLRELHGEQQAAAQVARVGHLQHQAAAALEQEVAGDALVVRAGVQRLDAGRVHQRHPVGVPGAQLDGRAGEVRDFDVVPGERAEQGALAHVRIADEDDVDVVFEGGVDREAGHGVPESGSWMESGRVRSRGWAPM